MDSDATTVFAVQLHEHEEPQNVARHILRTAHDARILFWHLEVLDIFEVGRTKFIRVRTDMLNPYPVVDRLLGQGRTVIAIGDDTSYRLRRPNGVTGHVPLVAMHRVPLPGHQRSYRGTKQWEAQFAS